MADERCPGCQVEPSQPHGIGCDVARCPACGTQRIQCNEHADTKAASIWTGRWPGLVECERLNWWSYFVPLQGWKSCEKSHPGAVHDLNRLIVAGAIGELVWDRTRQEWVLPEQVVRAVDDLRQRLDQAIRPALLLGLEEPLGPERAGEWAAWIVETAAKVAEDARGR